MQIIDTQKIADDFCEIIRERIDAVKSGGSTPCVHFIVSNKDTDDRRYIYDKHNFAQKMEIESHVHMIDDDITPAQLGELIEKLNRDNSVHAISLQPHLPKKLSFRNFVNLINPDKDVEGLTTLNQGRLFSGEPGIIPCVPLGICHLLRSVHERIAGLHAVIIGRSSMIGRPLAQLLLNSNCTVTSLHSYSRNLPEICRTADILISAVGHPELITSDYVKKGATVIDVGVNKIEKDGQVNFVGDVDFDSVKSVAGAITSSAGIEPMMLAYLVHNTLKLACCY